MHFMSSQREIKFVQRVSSPRNKKEELANAVSSWLENKGVGFQPTDVETKGKCLLSTLADALWLIDGHLQTEATLFLLNSQVFLVITFQKLADTSEKRWSTLPLKSTHASCWRNPGCLKGDAL